jgi:hypothetical protein
MKLCSNVLLQESADGENEHFHFYNSLVLPDDIAYQRKYFKKTPKGMPQIYMPDAIDDNEKMKHQFNQEQSYKKTLLKVAVLITTNASRKSTPQ